MIVVNFNIYTKQSTNIERVMFHCVDNEDNLKTVSFCVDTDKVRNISCLKLGSIVDVYYKPGFNNVAMVYRVDVSDESVTSIELN